MSNPAPWSIKGVDKETREKMKQMALSQGMSLADFLDTLISTTVNDTQNNFNDITETSTLMVSENKKEQLQEPAQSVNLFNNNQFEETKQHIPTSKPLNTVSGISKIIAPKEPTELKSEPKTEIKVETKSELNIITTQSHIKNSESKEPINNDLGNNDLGNNDLGNNDLGNNDLGNNDLGNNDLGKAHAVKIPAQKALKTKQNKIIPEKIKQKIQTPVQKNAHETQSKPNLFHKLTQKIGIETPIITQLSENNITDVIMRERQLRDFMRVQMTEMRDIMGTMFEKKIEKKLQELIHIITANTDNQSIQQSLNTQFNTDELLKKQDLNLQFGLFSEHIQKNLLQALREELVSIASNTESQYHNNVDDIQKMNDSIIENIDNHIDNIIQKTMHNHTIDSGNISASDLATLSAFQDTTQILFSRIGRIEDVCLTLDNKLSQIQGHYYQNKDNSGEQHPHPYIEEIISTQEELGNYIQSIPNFLNDAFKKHNNNNEMKEIVHTLHSFSKRLLGLENIIQKNATNENNTPNFQSHNLQSKSAPYLSDFNDDDDDDNILGFNQQEDYKSKNTSHNTDSPFNNDWDDSENQVQDIDNFVNKSNNDDTNMNDIRNFDRKAMLKGVRMNIENKINQRDDNSSSKFGGFNFNDQKKIMIFGGIAIVIVGIIGLIVL